jgi:hypothetical protein
MPPINEILTIDTAGGVEVLLESPRENDYIGTFELTLSSERLAKLKKAILRAHLYELADKYPPRRADYYDYETVDIELDTKRGRKKISVADTCWLYPRRLKPLFDLKNTMSETSYPEGILSRLISEASASPASAIAVYIEVAERSFQVGEPIDVTVVVKNVGRKPVILPSPECEKIASGSIEVMLRHVPLRAEEAATGLDSTTSEFGSDAGYQFGSLDTQAKEDLDNIVQIEPGKEWRIRMPKPLVATSPGEYELFGLFWIYRLYDRSILEKELGEGLVTGITWMRRELVVAPPE